VWPASFALARAYATSSSAAAGWRRRGWRRCAQALGGAERARGAARRSALAALATRLDGDAAAAADAAKVRTLAVAVRALAAVR
jgi:hypothetical protein